MNIKNAKKWSAVPRPQAYLMALVITLAAFSLRHLIHPLVTPYAPFQLLLAACLLTEYLVGLGPALFSGAVGLSLAALFFIPPFGELDGLSRGDVVVLANVVIVALLAIGLIEALRRALYSNQLVLKVSRSRHKISLHRENDRLYLAKKRAAAAVLLKRLFEHFGDVLLLKVAGTEMFPQPLLSALCGAPVSGASEDVLQHFASEDRLRLVEALAAAEAGGAARELPLRLACEGAQVLQVMVSVEGVALEDLHVVVVRLLRRAETGPAAA